MDLVERVGAYVGLAAFLGLAILALLLPQARDVRRLREWAGRAPERATDVAATQQHYLPPTPIEQVDQEEGRESLSANGSGASTSRSSATWRWRPVDW